MLLEEFFEEWEERDPSLPLYTCWRQARRYASSFKDVEAWLRPEQDKVRELYAYVLTKLNRDLR